MKNILLTLFLIISLPVLSQTFNLDRDWGTYFGDERFSLQGAERDGNGNLYIAGYVFGGISIHIDSETGEPTGGQTDYGNISDNFDYFDNAPHQSTHGGGGIDGFIAKFSPEGTLLWATFLGGENYDIIEAITIDRNNNVYVMGFTKSFTGIATPNAPQTEKAGETNLFLAKFAPDGNAVWSTYYGDINSIGNPLFWYRIFFGSVYNGYDADGNYIVHDGHDNLYITSSWDWSDPFPVTVTPTDGTGNNYISKFTDGGNFVWSTLYGINSSELSGLCFCDNALYATGFIQNLPNSPYPDNITYYGSQGSYQPTASNPLDAFIVKFNSNGERVWGTYYGGTGGEILRGNNLVCDGKGAVYHAMTTTSNNMATPGAFQEVRNMVNPILTKFNDNLQSQTNPERVWATYYGLGQDNSGSSGTPAVSVTLSDDDFVYLSGAVGLPENIASEGAWQETLGTSSTNGFVAKFSADGERIWGTYYNGEARSRLVRALPYGEQDRFYITGITLSNTGMTTENALQPERQVWNTEVYQGESFGIFIAHFSPTDLSAQEFVLDEVRVYPNPAKETLNIMSHYAFHENTKIEVYDMLGKKVSEYTAVPATINSLNISALSKGMYLLKITDNHTEKVFKFVKG